MSFKPFVFGVSLAVAAETIVHKEQTPHPIEEVIQQDPEAGMMNVYQISGSTIINRASYGEATLAIKDIK